MLLFSCGLVALVFILFMTWLHYDRLGEKGRQAITNSILGRHNELRGEGDECPWSVRLTAADKREAMRLARVELGLEVDKPFHADRPQKGWVHIIHPTSLGEPPAVVTKEAYEKVYREKGWINVSDGRYVQDRRAFLPGPIVNFKLPAVAELDPNGPPTNLDEVLDDKNKPNTTWLGQF